MRQAILLLALTAGLAGCTSSASLDPPPPARGLATLPGVVVPKFTVTHAAGAGTVPGYVFVAPKQNDTRALASSGSGRRTAIGPTSTSSS